MFAEQPYYQGLCQECLVHNSEIIRTLFTLLDHPSTHKSHFFEQRYENIYIDSERIPAVATVLSRALQIGAQLLQCGAAGLRVGFWFNIMSEGNVTLPHTHDDDDELLSGTYYVQVPERSGKLLLRPGSAQKIIVPQAGYFVFFHPQTVHEVTQHQHQTPRVSIGFNIGPVHGAELPD